jgi:MFS family permease
MQKYVSIYGSVYAIADISYSFAYAVGPIVAGHIVEHYGFTMLNVIVAVISIAYAPALYFLKDMYNYKVKDRKHTVDDKFLILNYIQYQHCQSFVVTMMSCNFVLSLIWKTGF